MGEGGSAGQGEGHADEQRPAGEVPSRQQVGQADAHAVGEQRGEERQLGQLGDQWVRGLERHGADQPGAEHDPGDQEEGGGQDAALRTL